MNSSYNIGDTYFDENERATNAAIRLVKEKLAEGNKQWDDAVKEAKEVKKKQLDSWMDKMITSKSSPEKAIRDNEGKTDWAIMPWEALEEAVKVLKWGEKHYGRFNWLNGNGLDQTDTLNSLSRHTIAVLKGEIKDPKTGELHIAHALCNCLFWITKYIKEEKEK